MFALRPLPALVAVTMLICAAPGSAANPTEAIRQRLRQADHVELACACGEMHNPWAFRGPTSDGRGFKTYGRHDVTAAGLNALRGMLVNAKVDSLGLLEQLAGPDLPCDDEAVPAFLLQFTGPTGRLFALFRFDTGQIALFDLGNALGTVSMAGRSEMWWQALAALPDPDPRLRGPRPLPALADSLAVGVSDTVAFDTEPVRHSMTPPKYPKEARSQGVEGTVYVMILVNPAGTVEDAIALRGDALLLDAAVVSARTARFSPATVDGEPVECWVMMPITFRLR